jgi:hypothetical protein
VYSAPASPPSIVPASEPHRPRPVSRTRSRTSMASVFSSMSEAASLSDFPALPPLPPSLSGYTTPYGLTPRPSADALRQPPVARSPFKHPDDARFAEARIAILSRALPALNTGALEPPHTGASLGVSFRSAPSPESARTESTYDDGANAEDDGLVMSARSVRRTSALDVPMSALDAPELVQIPIGASPASTRSAPDFPRRALINRPVPRVKSVGSAPRRATPALTPATSRESVPIEHFTFDIRGAPAPVAILASPVASSPEDVQPGVAM